MQPDRLQRGRSEQRTQERQAAVLVQVVQALLRRRAAEVVQQVAQVVQQGGGDQRAVRPLLLGQVRGLQRMFELRDRLAVVLRMALGLEEADDVGDAEAYGYQGSE
ncbi:hypothetical protein D9M70_560560 [compost metagenome]